MASSAAPITDVFEGPVRAERVAGGGGGDDEGEEGGEESSGSEE
jgi:hypothetical protein